MKTAVVGAVLLALSGAALAAGVLSPDDVALVAARVWPILLFVLAITVVAELAATGGLFDVIGGVLTRLSRGRTVVLWMLVVALSVLVTAFLSLDTTAVLLTPVVVVMARANRLDPLPFALVTVWVANTGSLFLPVSNLTNLLAVEGDGFADTTAFVGTLIAPASLAVGVAIAVLFVVLFRRIRARFVPAASPVVADVVLLRWAAGVVAILLPLLVLAPPWLPASIAALVLSAVFTVRARGVLRFSLVPWQLIVFASGLFLAVEVLEVWGLPAVLTTIAGSGDDLADLWRVAAVGALGANVVNNLPAYLALEPVADSSARLAALLVGTNAGPLITPWASLATLLWHQRLTAMDVQVSWLRFVVLGLIVVPPILILAVLPLAA